VPLSFAPGAPDWRWLLDRDEQPHIVGALPSAYKRGIAFEYIRTSGKM
jgi:hypothetical protein